MDLCQGLKIFLGRSSSFIERCFALLNTELDGKPIAVATECLTVTRRTVGGYKSVEVSHRSCVLEALVNDTSSMS